MHALPLRPMPSRSSPKVVERLGSRYRLHQRARLRAQLLKRWALGRSWPERRIFFSGPGSSRRGCPGSLDLAGLLLRSSPRTRRGRPWFRDSWHRMVH
jgi:hypothetical protein